MFLTLREAAARLGQSERQVRYALVQGKLQGEKRAGRWFVELETLPRTPGQQEVRRGREHRHARQVDAALSVQEDDGASRGYSVMRLRAFQAARPLLDEARAALGPEHPACLRLEEAILQLTIGCHRFRRRDKAVAYGAARDAASAAVAHLMLAQHEAAGPIAETVESEVLPAIAGLLRRSEGLRR